MKTFSETKGIPAFNWFAVLQKDCREIVLEHDPNHLERLALNWTTCATGNQCSVIDRWPDGKPKDKELVNLGSFFYAEIASMRTSIDMGLFVEANRYRLRAIDVLQSIEKRSEFLIKAVVKS